MNVQKKVKNIMSGSSSDRETALRKLAGELGCSLESTYGGDGGKHLEAELIRRIQEAGRSVREQRMWWIAVLATGASALSALAAWSAVCLTR